MTTETGLWECVGTDGGEWVICRRDKDGKRRTVAHVYGEANARLIAAAPEMAEFVGRAVASLSVDGRHNSEERLRDLAGLARALLRRIEEE